MSTADDPNLASASSAPSDAVAAAITLGDASFPSSDASAFSSNALASSSNADYDSASAEFNRLEVHDWQNARASADPACGEPAPESNPFADVGNSGSGSPEPDRAADAGVQTLESLPEVLFNFFQSKQHIDRIDPDRAAERDAEIEALMTCMRLIRECTGPDGYPAAWSKPLDPSPVTRAELVELFEKAVARDSGHRILSVTLEAFKIKVSCPASRVNAPEDVQYILDARDSNADICCTKPAAIVVSNSVGDELRDATRVSAAINLMDVPFTLPYMIAKTKNLEEPSLPAILLGTYHRSAAPGEIIISVDWAERVRGESRNAALRRLTRFTDPELRPFMARIALLFTPKEYATLCECVRIACTIRLTNLAKNGVRASEIPRHAWNAVFFGKWPF